MQTSLAARGFLVLPLFARLIHGLNRLAVEVASDLSTKLSRSCPEAALLLAVGGFVRQYQVDIDPNKLLGYGIPLRRVVERIRESNNDVGGKVIEYSGFEYVVCGRGYIEKIEDLDNRTGAFLLGVTQQQPLDKNGRVW